MHSVDIAIVLLYLTSIVCIGVAFRGKQATANQYFTAHGTFSGAWGATVIGLSIAATLFSGISLVVFVSTAYSDGARIALGLLGLPVIWLILRYWFLPRYLNGSWEHPYDIIENRFGLNARTAMSAIFILLRLGWMGVLIYAPTILIVGSFNLDETWTIPIILVIGLVSTAYTVIGGIRGVIYTDAVQFIIIACGLLFILVSIVWKIDLSLGEILDSLRERHSGQYAVLDFSVDLTAKLTFWTIVIGMSVTSLGTYLADQMCLQRYLASETPKAAVRAFNVSLIGGITIILVLVLLGLLLWIWYKHNPDRELPLNPDHVLAYFIASELPMGLSGLLIAALLSATMSSMTSGINSLAGALTNDWLPRFGATGFQDSQLLFGRWASLVVGICATISSCFASKLGPVLNSSSIVMGVFLGVMLGCMVLAVAHLQLKQGIVLCGIGMGLLVGILLANSRISPLWVSTGAFLATVAVPLCDVTLRKALARTIQNNQ